MQRYFGDKSLLAVFPCAMQIAVVLRDVPAAALAVSARSQFIPSTNMIVLTARRPFHQNMNHSTQVGCKYFAAKCSEVAFRALSDASKYANQELRCLALDTDSGCDRSPDQVLDLAEQAACVSISCQGFDDGMCVCGYLVLCGVQTR